MPRCRASCLASSVFPTPVGPVKRKAPAARSGGPSPARARLMAEADFNLVRLAEFAWSRMEPQEGQYDYVYKWPKEASVDDILKIGDQVRNTLKGMGVMFKLETVYGGD